MKLPSTRESLIMLCVLVVWLAVTALFVGFRPEHLWLALLIAMLFFVTGVTRRLVVALLPFIIFGISYDWMNIMPNYKVNPVDVEGLYNAEKSIFGITTAAGVVTPNEFFAIHNCSFMDFMAGVFYLCWVPVPIMFGLWLFFNGQRKVYLHFSLVFLLVNLLGFTFYYIHPAAPPWYVAYHGFDVMFNTHGEVAGLGAFDRMTGLGIFDALYARNSNVFAALPSLHSAYMLIAFIYALRARCSVFLKVLFAIISCGIWFTAVYTSHHYIIDVLSGITCALLGYVLFEYVFMKIPAFIRFINKYTDYISLKK
jgi:hypothetical protein